MVFSHRNYCEIGTVVWFWFLLRSFLIALNINCLIHLIEKGCQGDKKTQLYITLKNTTLKPNLVAQVYISSCMAD